MRKLSLPLRPLTPRTEGRTQTAERIDRLGLSLFVMAAFSCLFFALWREAAPAFLASGALSALLLPPLLRRETRAAQSRRSRQCRALPSSPRRAIRAERRSSRHIFQQLAHSSAAADRGKRKSRPESESKVSERRKCAFAWSKRLASLEKAYAAAKKRMIAP